MKRWSIIVCCAVLALYSCGPRTSTPGGETTAPQASALLTNTTNFPLAANATILSSQKFSQTVAQGERTSGLLNSGAGTYSGDEVIAATPQSFAELQAWMHQLESAPPTGYRRQDEGASFSQVHDIAARRGIDFAVFRDSNDPKRAVLVVGLDPARADRTLRPVLSLVKRYQMLPEALRGNIDSTVKNRTGISVEQMLQPGSPFGVALNALSTVSDQNSRAVILVAAKKD